MSIDAELVIPPDVEIFSIRDLSSDVRAGVDALDDDYAITRRRSRAPSRIIDKESAELLESFRTPTRIVDAVLSLATKRGLDPEKMLEEAYPLLYHLFLGRILVASDVAEPTALEPELAVGTFVEGFRLQRCIQVFEDNEVYLGRDASGRYAAVKFYRNAGDSARAALEREHSILSRIRKNRAPAVYSLAPVGSGLALVTEWVFGSDATTAAMLRRRELQSQQSLLALCLDIVDAFADLHSDGVLHGDVHPRNVLVDARGCVRLIDFGLAQEIGNPSTLPGSRGGIAFYFDPEFANGQRTGKHVELSIAGEQYSVASLIYQLWTGVYYMDWSLERDELLRQIVQDQPVTFQARNVASWPELESALTRALEKRASRRFATMRAFADTLRALLPTAYERDRKANMHRHSRARERTMLAQALQRYSLGGDALRDGLADPPFASINYGAAGIAYAINTIARRRNDSQLLALADVWAQKAYSLSSHEKAFYDPAIELSEGSVGKVSLFHSISGVHLVRALVSVAMGDFGSTATAIQAFLSQPMAPSDRLDLTLGKASVLLGCAELVETVSRADTVDLNPVRRRGDELAMDLLTIMASEDMSQSEAVSWLGIAHGWAGLIFALLRWAKATARTVDPIVLGNLDELASMAEPVGSGVRWPVHNNRSNFMDGWCNGSAGHAMLFALAHDVAESAYGEIAERAATNAWASETRLGTLCCGLGGIAYALIAVYRMTRSNLWLERARGVARRAASDSSAMFLRDSLYKGSVGVALLAEELAAPEVSAMPLVEPVS